MAIGPIQAFVIGFPDNELLEGRIAEELARLSEIGQIKIIDAVFVIRDGDDLAVLSVSDLDDEQRAELAHCGRRTGRPRRRRRRRCGRGRRARRFCRSGRPQRRRGARGGPARGPA